MIMTENKIFGLHAIEQLTKPLPLSSCGPAHRAWCRTATRCTPATCSSKTSNTTCPTTPETKRCSVDAMWTSSSCGSCGEPRWGPTDRPTDRPTGRTRPNFEEQCIVGIYMTTFHRAPSGLRRRSTNVWSYPSICTTKSRTGKATRWSSTEKYVQVFLIVWLAC